MLNDKQKLLNGICPYFTMFPLQFPLDFLNKKSRKKDWVLDPFCGRGTTNFAARLCGMPSVGIDSHPVAIALTKAKLASVTPWEIVETAQMILAEKKEPEYLPTGRFWDLAFHPEVLPILCRLREGLITNSQSDSRQALLGILLGALHGPRAKVQQSYFSNQSQRTYAPKPNYAIRFWESNGLLPPKVDVIGIIEMRAKRYYLNSIAKQSDYVICGDSRESSIFHDFLHEYRFQYVISSPPYYGMQTYRPDQWLRMWFVGGEPSVDYSKDGQLVHSSPEAFVEDLKHVWINTGSVCKPGAELVVRFGGIPSKKVRPLDLLSKSLEGTNWHIMRHESAGMPSHGKRQALHITQVNGEIEEIDLYARWRGN